MSKQFRASNTNNAPSKSTRKDISQMTLEELLEHDPDSNYDPDRFQAVMHEIGVDKVADFSDKNANPYAPDDIDMEGINLDLEKLKEHLPRLISRLTKHQQYLINGFLAGKSQFEMAAELGITQSAIHKGLLGNLDYSHKYKGKRFGGVINKLRKLAAKDPEILRAIDQQFSNVDLTNMPVLKPTRRRRSYQTHTYLGNGIVQRTSKRTGKSRYYGYARLKNKKYRIGSHDTLEEAQKAMIAKRRELGIGPKSTNTPPLVAVEDKQQMETPAVSKRTKEIAVTENVVEVYKRNGTKAGFYRAKLYYLGRRFRLGPFETIKEAEEAARQKKIELGIFTYPNYTKYKYGYPGVYRQQWDSNGVAFVAYVKINGHTVHIKSFRTAEEAFICAENKKAELNEGYTPAQIDWSKVKKASPDPAPAPTAAPKGKRTRKPKQKVEAAPTLPTTKPSFWTRVKGFFGWRG